MKIFCTCSSDTYITDKIILDNRSHNSNVGAAGTLDLFKLYNETLFQSSGSQNEVSRILTKFDLSHLRKKVSKDININDQNFSAKLKLFDITAGNAGPSNFTVMVTPLSQSFTEGFGKDVGSFSNLGSSNFLTASYESGLESKWFLSGANSEGQMDASNIDHIIKADLDSVSGNNVVNITATQKFKTGRENLDLDITTLVSASLSGRIPNHGYRISFSGSDDSDKKTRFVKRFASRHVSDPSIRPRIEISFDDSLQDNHLNFQFNTSGSLYLENIVNSKRQNLLFGSALSQVTGENCMNLKIESGIFKFTTPVSQVKRGSDNLNVLGLYSASFAIDSFNTSNISKDLTLRDKISRDGFIEFKTYWVSTDGTYAFHTGSLVINKVGSFSGTKSSSLTVQTTNLAPEYKKSDVTKIKVFIKDTSVQHTSSKKQTLLSSIIVPESYYRVVDFNTGKTIFDFDTEKNSTRLSSDAGGMFFRFDFSILSPGRAYYFEYLLIDGDNRRIYSDKNSRFTVR